MIFAKAEARAAVVEADSGPEALPRPEHLPPETPGWSGDVAEARLELHLRAWAIPVALGSSFLVWRSGLHGLMRTFLSMWIHETGHAVAAWFCGYPSFPGPWKTPIGNERSVFVVILLAAALGHWARRSFRSQRRVTGIVACVLIATQLGLTIGLTRSRALELFTFAGDGGCLVLGPLLMATFYLPPDHPLRRDWLRWGFLVIGAAAFVDAFATWVSGRHDVSAIPFGEIEGVGLSDPSKLTEVYGWTVHQLVSRYVWLGGLCLVALGALYCWGLLASGHAYLKSLAAEGRRSLGR